jgi:hypothetical protein
MRLSKTKLFEFVVGDSGDVPALVCTAVAGVAQDRGVVSLIGAREIKTNFLIAPLCDGLKPVLCHVLVNDQRPTEGHRKKEGNSRSETHVKVPSPLAMA